MEKTPLAKLIAVILVLFSIQILHSRNQTTHTALDWEQWPVSSCDSQQRTQYETSSALACERPRSTMQGTFAMAKGCPCETRLGTIHSTVSTCRCFTFQPGPCDIRFNVSNENSALSKSHHAHREHRPLTNYHVRLSSTHTVRDSFSSFLLRQKQKCTCLVYTKDHNDIIVVRVPHLLLWHGGGVSPQVYWI